VRIKLNVTAMPMQKLYQLRNHNKWTSPVLEKWQRQNMEKFNSKYIDTKAAKKGKGGNRPPKMMPAKVCRPRWTGYNVGCSDGEAAEQEMDLILYPHDVLKTPTERVPLGFVKSEEFKQKISSMFQVMYRRKGIGLAAPQVGWNARVLIGNPYGREHHDSGAFVLINPEVSPFGPMVPMAEGCLSIPGIYAEVNRPASVLVRSLTFEGTEKEIVFDGILARIVQHEFDHLDGTLFIDRLEWSELKKVQAQVDEHVSRITKLREEREMEAKRAKEEAEKKKEEEKRKREEERAKSKAEGKKKPVKTDEDLTTRILGVLGMIHGGNQKVSQKEFDKFLRKKVKKDKEKGK
jgi:peptide deformylase